MNAETVQVPCRPCGAMLQFSPQSIGATIPYPVCQQLTELGPAHNVSEDGDVFISPGLTSDEVLVAFRASIRKPRVSFSAYWKNSAVVRFSN
jgi:hypothetical protein